MYTITHEAINRWGIYGANGSLIRTIRQDADIHVAGNAERIAFQRKGTTIFECLKQDVTSIKSKDGTTTTISKNTSFADVFKALSPALLPSRIPQTSKENTKIVAVGFESGSLPNSSFSASETYEKPGGRYQAYHARLNQPTAWEPRNVRSGHWLKVDLLSSRKIVKINTQGNGYGANEFVRTFQLFYGDTDGTPTAYNNGEILTANVDRNSVVEIALTPFRARYIKVVPVSWNIYPAMRLEVYEEVIDLRVRQELFAINGTTLRLRDTLTNGTKVVQGAYDNIKATWGSLIDPYVEQGSTDLASSVGGHYGSVDSGKDGVFLRYSFDKPIALLRLQMVARPLWVTRMERLGFRIKTANGETTLRYADFSVSGLVLTNEQRIEGVKEIVFAMLANATSEDPHTQFNYITIQLKE